MTKPNNNILVWLEAAENIVGQLYNSIVDGYCTHEELSFQKIVEAQKRLHQLIYRLQDADQTLSEKAEELENQQGQNNANL